MTELLKAIADLAWPVVVLTALVLFLRPLRQVIRTAEEREFTLEIGGQRLSIGQLSQQQSDRVEDLRKELADLQERLAELDAAPEPPQDLEVIEEPPPPPSGVLWCDDHPENNALEIQQLTKAGVQVETVTNTDAALRALRVRDYRLIVSDMGRTENGIDVPDAGLRLTREVRGLGIQTPIVIYASAFAASRYRDEARAAGADDITDSSYQLSKHFRRLRLLR